MTRRTLVLLAIFSLIVTGTLTAQVPILEVSFDTIPEDVSIVSSHISLESDVLVTGELETTAGVRFPDGTLQATAGAGGGQAEACNSLTANDGLYSNTIADFVPPNAYVEVCFKTGSVLADIHAVSESTAGGACVPGDRGWILELLERAAGVVSWTTAKADCLASGMRLPEPFEWQYACNNAGGLGVGNIDDGWEWATNQVYYASVGLFASILGNGSCSVGSTGRVAHSNGTLQLWAYRCAR